MKTRFLDQRMLLAHRQGKTTNYAASTGEEAITCGFQRMLSPGDMNFPTYRQSGLLVSAGFPLTSFMGLQFGNELDPLQGKNLPPMHSSKAHGFFTISGNLATQYVQAVGWAMASAIDGNDRVAAAWIGDGATAEGDFHSALLYASVYRPPVVLNITNNQWAISSFVGIAGGHVPFEMRAHGYGLASLRVDGNDARTNNGPTLIEYFTYRAEGHSTSDDPGAYRAAKEFEKWPLGDPVERLKQHLIRLGEWDEALHAALHSELADLVKAAQKEAEANGILGHGMHQPFETMFEDVFEEMPWHLKEQCGQMLDEQQRKFGPGWEPK